VEWGIYRRLSCWSSTRRGFLTRIFKESTGYEYNFSAATGRVSRRGLPILSFSARSYEICVGHLSQRRSTPRPTPIAPDTVTLEGNDPTINQEPDATFVSAMSPHALTANSATSTSIFPHPHSLETYVADTTVSRRSIGLTLHFYAIVNKQLSQFIPWI